MRSSGPGEKRIHRRRLPDLVSAIVKARFWLAAGASLAVLYYANLHSFLLFHVLIEMFSVVVAFAIFMFAWNTRDHIRNGSLVILGAAYFCIGALDLLHTVSYKGMGVLQTSGADIATQLWIAARYIESATLAAAPLLAARTIRMPRAMAFYGGLCLLAITVILVWPIFPTCYVEGQGLTPFKKISEYVIAAILVVGLVNLNIRRQYFERKILQMLAVSMLLTIASEWMFTVYISVYGISNLVGHLLKLGSFWLIYKAIIETGLREPYALLFRDLARSEKRHRDLVDRLPTGICEVSPDLRIHYVNPAGLDLLGYTPSDVPMGLDLGEVLDPEDHEQARQGLEELSRGKMIESSGYRLRRKDGTMADVIVSSSPVFREGELQSIQTSLTDVTELNRLQNRLQEARKMEAVAMLAGGMAHEINNVLMGVTGGIEILKLSADEGPLAEEDFVPVLRGCDRIAGLIKRLLAYSRGGRYRSEAIDVARFVRSWLPEIEPRLGPDIHLSLQAAAPLPAVTADPTQLEMVVSEIVANALEAVAGAGRITVDLDLREIDAEEAGRRPGMQPGRYVRLRVRDTGKGMNAETLEQIFIPFYSEHFPGRGMGMAAVYGIVKNHGGWIGVDSELGRGTTVNVYLPARHGDARAPSAPKTVL